MAKRKEMLKGMKMPQEQKDPMLETESLDMSELEGPMAAEGEELPEGEIPMEEESQPNPELEKMEDDELIEELKRRGYDIEQPDMEAEEAPLDEEMPA